MLLADFENNILDTGLVEAPSKRDFTCLCSLQAQVK